jgi:hypothetical protein
MNVSEILGKLKQYPIAIGGVAAAIVLALVFFMRKDNVPNLEVDRDVLRTQWEAMLENDQRSGVDLIDQVDKVKKASENVRSRLMDRDQKAINYQYFYQLEERTKITLSRIAQSDTLPPASPPPGKPKLKLFSPIDYAISVVGTFQQVVTFLNEMEHGRFFTRVEKFSCGLAGGDNAGLIQVSMQMDVLGKKI